jgi:hypothetical protein
MTYELHVDANGWRQHLASLISADADLVPVTKGNGYGLGLDRTAAEAKRAGARMLAVGTIAELDDVRPHTDADLLVLQPWQRGLDPAPRTDGTVYTAATLDSVAGLADAGAPYVVEVLSSVMRFGIPAEQLAEVAGLSRGVAIHLPLDAAPGARVREVAAVVAAVEPIGFGPVPLWVSHLTDDEADEVRRAHPDWRLRQRVGTRLWLGKRETLQARAQVLAVHRVTTGERIGYRQRRVSRAADLIIASGGTAHGVGLEAPTTPAGVGDRGKTVAKGLLEAGGRLPSPFRRNGKRLWFAEPPHMQVSLLLAKPGSAPDVGSFLDVDARMTTAAFDRVVGWD